MCGRFTIILDIGDLAERFGFDPADLETYVPRYNAAPGQEALAVLADRRGGRRAEFLRWGLIPSWAKDPSIGNKLINARAETLAQKPSFRVAFRKRRCLVLADGFYEWMKQGGRKIPMRVVLKSRAPFAFAGLWEEWRPPTGEPLRSCTIVTTSPNAFMEKIHHRMPAILSRDAEPVWLDPGVEAPEELTPLLVPYPAEAFEAYPVSKFVNAPTHESPECIKPL